jgi:hypothetical protein
MINNWIHRNTKWKHSSTAAARLSR